MDARDLLIVDNSGGDSGWTVRKYLEQWCQISKSLDIATGYFEIGALLELKEHWRSLEKIRILMGDETSTASGKILRESLTKAAEAGLDRSLQTERSRTKDPNLFLEGVPAVKEALRSGQIEVRVFDKGKFHAKTYIAHGRLDVVGSQALVGSSNFTRPGLTQNIELNVQLQNSRDVTLLQEWFEAHWRDSKDVTALAERIVDRHVREFTPFEVFAKALSEICRGVEPTKVDWERTESKLFKDLDSYQQEAYHALLTIANQHNGAFLCDGVGLGKTYVGLMLIERFIMKEGKRVALFAPKTALDGVWRHAINRRLDHIAGSSRPYSSLCAFSHTDLSIRDEEMQMRLDGVMKDADVVIIDEAHHFRNGGSSRKLDSGRPAARYSRLFEILSQGRSKKVFLLTATPVNNSVVDLRRMIELFSRTSEARNDVTQEQYFAKTLGINNLTHHFNQLEMKIAGTTNDRDDDDTRRMQEAIHADQIFRLIVQRSRAYAIKSAKVDGAGKARFPVREKPTVATYSLRKTYGKLLEDFSKAFRKNQPLFQLAMYHPIDFAKSDSPQPDNLLLGRQQQIVTLIRTQFLKRFESSVYAFEMSCTRLIGKLLAFAKVNSISPTEVRRFEKWKADHADLLQQAVDRQTLFWAEPEDQIEDEDEGDISIEELVTAIEPLRREEYHVERMLDETYEDLDDIVPLLRETRKFDEKHDDKLQALIRLLGTLTGQKVLIFTEFADTARYVKHALVAAGIQAVEQLDSGSKVDRTDVIRRFAPYYNDSSSAKIKAAGKKEIQVLVATDVLSEGLNLQDACLLVNYDIHWNPVRLMQRIGRVDRRMNDDFEKAMCADHPEVSPLRGKVRFWNFLPPDELNDLLSLWRLVKHKTLVISKTLGIEGRALLTPEDELDDLREFHNFEREYEGGLTRRDQLNLDYKALRSADPSIFESVGHLPNGIFSGRQRVSSSCRGVFMCYALPALDRTQNMFTLEAGESRWYLLDLESRQIIEEPGAILDCIRSTPETPRLTTLDRPLLVDVRNKIYTHINKTYLRQINAPVGAEPLLKCWMELTGD